MEPEGFSLSMKKYITDMMAEAMERETFKSLAEASLSTATKVESVKSIASTVGVKDYTETSGIETVPPKKVEIDEFSFIIFDKS
jgi:hypothetical protein